MHGAVCSYRKASFYYPDIIVVMIKTFEAQVKEVTSEIEYIKKMVALCKARGYSVPGHNVENWEALLRQKRDTRIRLKLQLRGWTQDQLGEMKMLQLMRELHAPEA
jgi:hypothetical protein